MIDFRHFPEKAATNFFSSYKNGVEVEIENHDRYRRPWDCCRYRRWEPGEPFIIQMGGRIEGLEA